MEKLLHYVWKHRLLPLKTLTTTDGQEVEVIDTGLMNSDAGPDFFNAKLRIGNTMWAGNIEIHLKASDWYRHGHDKDEAYDNVVLHVVQTDDCTVTTSKGKQLPQLILDIPADLHSKYEELHRTENYPRCHRVIRSIDPFHVHSWMDTLLVERLKERAGLVTKRLKDVNGDWEWALFVTLARNYGFGLNGDAFEAWAKRLPLDKIRKHRDELFQIESIFLGLAGMLDNEVGLDKEEQEKLRKEFTYQSHLFTLPDPMPASQWKYLRTRPQNFPHVRLRQLARIFHEERITLASLKDAAQAENALQSLYKLLNVSSRNTQHLLIINTVVPVLYAWAMGHNDWNLRERLLDLLRELPAENNNILRLWQECGLSVTNAADSQALIQLKREYCDRLDCLRCQFGYQYMKTMTPTLTLPEGRE